LFLKIVIKKRKRRRRRRLGCKNFRKKMVSKIPHAVAEGPWGPGVLEQRVVGTRVFHKSPIEF